MRNAVAPATLRRYRHSLPRWEEFINACFPHDTATYLMPRTLTQPALLELCHAFINFLRTDHALSGQSIAATLSGLNHEFRANLVDTSALRDDSIATVHRRFTHEDNLLTAPRGKRIPFTTAMVLSMVSYADTHHHLRHRMHAVGALLGYFCAMRASEYCVCPHSTHTLMSNAVEFEYTRTPGHLPYLIPSYGLGEASFHHITAVRITVHTAKNIAPGRGQATWFSVPTPGSSLFPIVAHLYQWARSARLVPDAPFLSYFDPGSPGRVILRYTAMNAAIKAAAIAAGIDPNGCGTHSLRIASATNLAAAGADSTAIMQAGRWRSLPTAAAYPDRTTQSNDAQLLMLQSSHGITTRDIHMARCLPSRTSAAPAARTTHASRRIRRRKSQCPKKPRDTR